MRAAENLSDDYATMPNRAGQERMNPEHASTSDTTGAQPRSGAVHVRVLVCGGRDFKNWRFLYERMDRLLEEHGPFEVVMHGGAQGADSYADTWAEQRGIPILGSGSL